MQRVGDGASGARGSCSDRSPYLEYREARRGMGMEMGVGGPGQIGINQAESRYIRKYKTLVKELSQIEKENLAIFGELKDSRARVERLRFEHKLLLDKLRETLNSRKSRSARRGTTLMHDLDQRYHKHVQAYPSVRHSEGCYDKSKKQSSDTEPWDYCNATGSFDSSSSTRGEWFNTQNDTAETHSCQSYREGQCIIPFASKKSKRQKSKDRDPNAPKRPSNAFMYFCEMQRESLKKQREALDEREQEKAGLNNLTKALGSRWQALTEDERREWKEQFLAKVEKYYSDMKCYKGNNYSGQPQATQQLPSKNSTFGNLCYMAHSPYSKSDDDKYKGTKSPSDHNVKDYNPSSRKSKSEPSHESSTSQSNPPHKQDDPPFHQSDFRASLGEKNETFENSAFSYSSQSELSDPDPSMLGDLESDSMDRDSKHSKDSQLPNYHRDV